MLNIDPRTLGNCKQCQGVLCIRPDRIACTQCGLPVEETIVKAATSQPQTVPKVEARPVAEAGTGQPTQQTINGTPQQQPQQGQGKRK